MSNNGYSGSGSEKRFVFSESGYYNAPRKNEAMLEALVWAVFAVIFGITTTAAILALYNGMEKTQESAHFGLTGFVLFCWLVVVAVITTVLVVLVKMIKRGYQCSYTADEEKFTTNEGGEFNVIYYSDVESVDFVPRLVFGKTCGYDVVIKHPNSLEVYHMISDGYISEKSTPFYIIVQRIEEIHDADKDGHYAQKKATLADSIFPDTLPEKPVCEVIRTEKKAKLQETVPISAETETYIANDGRETLYNELQASGRFYVRYGAKKVIACLALIAVISFVLARFLYLAYFIPHTVNTILIIVLVPLIASMLLMRLYIGEEHTYRADGRAFVVKDKKGRETCIFYKNVKDISYRKLFRGYEVKIVMNSEIILYRCIDKRAFQVKQSVIPFDIIVRNIR